MREKEHKQVMSDLQKWPMEISDALKKCKRLRKENKTYNYLHSQILRELPELKNSIRVLRAKKRKLWEEHIALQESCEEVKKLLKEVREKICDPCAEKHQEQESLDERLKNLLKQEMVGQQRDLAEKLQHQISVPEMRIEKHRFGFRVV
ncbi:Disks large homolog 5 [Lemmus lemmus]